ncbi:unnamed protein product, partial [Amoebophrya sp. A120]|eukprot:GSA120T00016866001.1
MAIPLPKTLLSLLYWRAVVAGTGVDETTALLGTTTVAVADAVAGSPEAPSASEQEHQDAVADTSALTNKEELCGFLVSTDSFQVTCHTPHYSTCKNQASLAQLCPPECPFVDGDPYFPCVASCVKEEQCRHRNGPSFSFPNSTAHRCQPCEAIGCAHCDPHRAGKCHKCKEPVFRLDERTGTCVYVFETNFGQYFTIFILTAVVLLLPATCMKMWRPVARELIQECIRKHIVRCKPYVIKEFNMVQQAGDKSEDLIDSGDGQQTRVIQTQIATGAKTTAQGASSTVASSSNKNQLRLTLEEDEKERATIDRGELTDRSEEDDEDTSTFNANDQMPENNRALAISVPGNEPDYTNDPNQGATTTDPPQVSPPALIIEQASVWNTNMHRDYVCGVGLALYYNWLVFLGVWALVCCILLYCVKISSDFAFLATYPEACPALKDDGIAKGLTYVGRTGPPGSGAGGNAASAKNSGGEADVTSDVAASARELQDFFRSHLQVELQPELPQIADADLEKNIKGVLTISDKEVVEPSRMSRSGAANSTTKTSPWSRLFPHTDGYGFSRTNLMQRTPMPVAAVPEVETEQLPEGKVAHQKSEEPIMSRAEVLTATTTKSLSTSASTVVLRRSTQPNRLLSSNAEKAKAEENDSSKIGSDFFSRLTKVEKGIQTVRGKLGTEAKDVFGWIKTQTDPDTYFRREPNVANGLQQARLNFAQDARRASYVLFVFTVASLLIFATIQKKEEERFDAAHPNIVDFGVEISGLPTDVTDPGKLLQWVHARLKQAENFQDAEDVVLNVSIAYAYEPDYKIPGVNLTFRQVAERLLARADVKSLRGLYRQEQWRLEREQLRRGDSKSPDSCAAAPRGGAPLLPRQISTSSPLASQSLTSMASQASRPGGQNTRGGPAHFSSVVIPRQQPGGLAGPSTAMRGPAINMEPPT